MSFSATVLTLYRDMFPGPLGHALAGRALGEGRWSLDAVDIRSFATDRHRTVDGTPAGGGPGMVMRADVVAAAIDGAGGTGPRLLMSPRGKPFDQQMAVELAEGPGVTIVCGRFEGVDQRVIDARGLTEISIGDYVLAGGEVAALAILDAVVRLSARRDGQRPVRHRGELFGRAARTSAVHPARAVRGARDPGRPHQRRPWPRRRVARRRAQGADGGAPAGPAAVRASG